MSLYIKITLPPRTRGMLYKREHVDNHITWFYRYEAAMSYRVHTNTIDTHFRKLEVRR